MPVSRLFEDYFFYNPETLVQTLCDRIAQDGVENVRSEALRRMEAGTLPLGLGAPLFGCFEVESIIPELRQLLRSPSSTIETRLIAYSGLANAKVDLIHEMEALDRSVSSSLIANLRQLSEALAVARGGGGPFRALLKVDPADLPAIEEQVATIVQGFLDSPQAEGLPDPGEAGWWIQEFLVLAYTSNLGTPLTMTGADVEDVLSELMPHQVAIESLEQAVHAITALRAFFPWVAQVIKMPLNRSVLQMLSILEPHFPSMLLDETRFGPARGFVTAGLSKGFDMSTEAGREAFELQWNRDHPLDATRAVPAKKKKELAAAKKRKAKMEKASRKKNRRKK